MNIYELTIVLDGKATKAQKKAKIEFIEKLVNIQEGNITSSEDWGVRDLAFKIDKLDTGAYLYFEIELKASSVIEINDKLRLEDGIIRYLLVKKDK